MTELTQEMADRLHTAALSDLWAHRLQQGTYGERLANGHFRGCSIGCILRAVLGREHRVTSLGVEGLPHARVERLTGLPLDLLNLQDNIFENLDQSVAPDWHVQFCNALRGMPKPIDWNLVRRDWRVAMGREFPNVRMAHCVGFVDVVDQLWIGGSWQVVDMSHDECWERVRRVLEETLLTWGR